MAHYWEYHLPVNPPGAFFREGFDVMLTEVELANWATEGGYEYQPRPRDNVQKSSRDLGPVMALDDDAPELDYDYGYDCD